MWALSGPVGVECQIEYSYLEISVRTNHSFYRQLNLLTRMTYYRSVSSRFNTALCRWLVLTRAFCHSIREPIIAAGEISSVRST